MFRQLFRNPLCRDQNKTKKNTSECDIISDKGGRVAVQGLPCYYLRACGKARHGAAQTHTLPWQFRLLLAADAVILQAIIYFDIFLFFFSPKSQWG